MKRVCVPVDGVLVYFDPETGSFHCEIPLERVCVHQSSPNTTFLGQTWNYTSRPPQFIVSPIFIDYLIALLGIIRVSYIFRVLSFKRFLIWSSPRLKEKRFDALQILAKRMTAIFRLLPLLWWHVECLEVSGLFTRLGRNLGLNTKLVIAVRSAPFSGHAWCQLGDEVINDSADVAQQFVKIFETSKDVS